MGFQRHKRALGFIWFPTRLTRASTATSNASVSGLQRLRKETVLYIENDTRGRLLLVCAFADAVFHGYDGCGDGAAGSACPQHQALSSRESVWCTCSLFLNMIERISVSNHYQSTKLTGSIASSIPTRFTRCYSNSRLGAEKQNTAFDWIQPRKVSH